MSADTSYPSLSQVKKRRKEIDYLQKTTSAIKYASTVSKTHGLTRQRENGALCDVDVEPLWSSLNEIDKEADDKKFVIGMAARAGLTERETEQNLSFLRPIQPVEHAIEVQDYHATNEACDVAQVLPELHSGAVNQVYSRSPPLVKTIQSAAEQAIKLGLHDLVDTMPTRHTYPLPNVQLETLCLDHRLLRHCSLISRTAVKAQSNESDSFCDGARAEHDADMERDQSECRCEYDECPSVTLKDGQHFRTSSWVSNLTQADMLHYLALYAPTDDTRERTISDSSRSQETPNYYLQVLEERLRSFLRHRSGNDDLHQYTSAFNELFLTFRLAITHAQFDCGDRSVFDNSPNSPSESGSRDAGTKIASTFEQTTTPQGSPTKSLYGKIRDIESPFRTSRKKPVRTITGQGSIARALLSIKCELETSDMNESVVDSGTSQPFDSHTTENPANIFEPKSLTLPSGEQNEQSSDLIHRSRPKFSAISSSTYESLDNSFAVFQDPSQKGSNTAFGQTRDVTLPQPKDFGPEASVGRTLEHRYPSHILRKSITDFSDLGKEEKDALAGSATAKIKCESSPGKLVKLASDFQLSCLGPSGILDDGEPVAYKENRPPPPFMKKGAIKAKATVVLQNDILPSYAPKAATIIANKAVRAPLSELVQGTGPSRPSLTMRLRQAFTSASFLRRLNSGSSSSSKPRITAFDQSAVSAADNLAQCAADGKACSTGLEYDT